MTPLEPTFVCFACHHDFRHYDANLDAQNHLICGGCYIANPPLVDVEIIFAQAPRPARPKRTEGVNGSYPQLLIIAMAFSKMILFFKRSPFPNMLWRNINSFALLFTGPRRNTAGG
jgi:hypothetical protein